MHGLSNKSKVCPTNKVSLPSKTRTILHDPDPDSDFDPDPDPDSDPDPDPDSCH